MSAMRRFFGKERATVSDLGITPVASRIRGENTLSPIFAPVLGFYMIQTPKSKRQPSAAFMRPVQPDEKLSAVIGSEPVPRTEVTRKIWDYIRLHNLQDAKDRKQVNADANLKEIFGGKDQVSMFELTKLVFQHLN